jgi:hypothetical protein
MASFRRKPAPFDEKKIPSTSRLGFHKEMLLRNTVKWVFSVSQISSIYGR